MNSQENKKKQIAFILYRMNQGGPSRVFLNIISTINRNEYDISLYLFTPDGDLYDQIPSYVNVKLVKPRGLFCAKKEDVLGFYIWSPLKFISRVTGRVMKFFNKKTIDGSWKFIEHLVIRDACKYEFAMSLTEGIPNYYLSRFINTKVKIGRIPTDYKVANLNQAFDINYFSHLDYIVTNSTTNLNSLYEIFPSITDKFVLLRNIILPETIMAKANSEPGFKDNFSGIRILTLSRLHDTKGTDLAIEACRLLVAQGFNVRWYIMGNGAKDKYTAIVEKNGIKNNFAFLDSMNNPFPCLKECNIYVQPSRYEGSSNAVFEAKALGKPIVITNFNSALEHITHMTDGLIADMNANSLASSIALLINDNALTNRLTNYLKIHSTTHNDDFRNFFNSLNKQNQ